MVSFSGGRTSGYLTNRLLKEEKKHWKSEITTEEWKLDNLKKIKSRMQGWQLNTFEESYKHKINEGISLFKKKLLES